jgi:hypothetical protein
MAGIHGRAMFQSVLQCNQQNKVKVIYSVNNTTYIEKVKQSRYRPGVAQRVPGS